jgi:hypothetical protein
MTSAQAQRFSDLFNQQGEAQSRMWLAERMLNNTKNELNALCSMWSQDDCADTKRELLALLEKRATEFEFRKAVYDDIVAQMKSVKSA